MSKFSRSTSYAAGVSKSAANKKKLPNRRRKVLADGRVKIVRTNKAGRKVTRIKSKSGDLLKIKKAATGNKAQVTKKLSGGGAYVKRVARGTGKDRRAFTYKGKMRGQVSGRINDGKGVLKRSVVGSGLNRVMKKFATKKVGDTHRAIKQKNPRFKRNKTNI